MKMNYEDAIKKLRDICDRLRDEKTTLEETVSLYKEGKQLVSECEKMLNDFSASIGGEDK